MKPTKGKLMQVYNLGPDNGRNWYTEAHNIAREMASSFGLTVYQTSGIIAALSCNTSWLRNLQAAWEYCRTGTTGHLQIALKKANAVLEAKSEDEILEALNGLKIQNFYLNIARPENWGPVTIDRHAFNAACFGARRPGSKVRVTPGRFSN